LNKKAFTLIELLVVIVLIGITSLVAVPNVREFIINREYKNDVYKIATIANSLRNDLETKKADITSNLPYELAFFNFSYAGDDMTNGVQINIGKADSSRLQNFKNVICDINQRNNLNFWNQTISYNFNTDRNIQSNVNETFKNLRLGFNSGPGWACYSIDMSQNFNRIWFDRYNGGPIGICHVSKVAVGARCTPSIDNNNPYYGISITKFGRAAIHKYDYATSTWKEEQN
jgi:prepilin-type N-terminal cleavage/methylation domain-containing protein